MVKVFAVKRLKLLVCPGCEGERDWNGENYCFNFPLDSATLLLWLVSSVHAVMTNEKAIVGFEHDTTAGRLYIENRKGRNVYALVKLTKCFPFLFLVFHRNVKNS